MSSDPVVQGSINTLRNWRMRRDAKGKLTSADEVSARIQELWPGMTEDKMAEIIKGTMA